MLTTQQVLGGLKKNGFRVVRGRQTVRRNGDQIELLLYDPEPQEEKALFDFVSKQWKLVREAREQNGALHILWVLEEHSETKQECISTHTGQGSLG